jgi:exopolysaccharide biosynthesis polyprenyl glycosylphosphotransferase
MVLIPTPADGRTARRRNDAGRHGDVSARGDTDVVVDLRNAPAVVTAAAVATAPMPERRGRRVLHVPVVLLAVDLVCLALPAAWTPAHAKAVIATAALGALFLWSGGLYRSRLQALVLDDLPSLVGRDLAAIGVVSTVSALRHQGGSLAGLITALAEAMTLLIAGRVTVTATIRLARRRRWVSHSTLVVGRGPVAERLVGTLSANPAYGLEVAGYVADRPSAAGALARVGYLGHSNDLATTLARTGVHVVVLADRGVDEARLAALTQDALQRNCELFVVPRLHDAVRQPVGTETIGAVPVVRVRHDLRLGLSWRGKRLFDAVASAAALVLLAPLLAACAAAVRADSGPGILFRQVRVGGDGKPFELLKFRTLRPSDDYEAATTWSVGHDPRVTRVGRFLRRTSLDELPQLWNILRGDMTIVGPRPERPHFVEKFSAESPHYALRHRVPSGLTGLAQVNGLRGDTSIAERAGLDNYYIENWSLWLDVKVIIRTVMEVLAARGR